MCLLANGFLKRSAPGVEFESNRLRLIEFILMEIEPFKFTERISYMEMRHAFVLCLRKSLNWKPMTYVHLQILCLRTHTEHD